MRVKKYNLYNITSLYVIQVSDNQGIFIDYNMLFSISTLVSSIDLQLKTIIICCDYVTAQGLVTIQVNILSMYMFIH